MRPTEAMDRPVADQAPPSPRLPPAVRTDAVDADVPAAVGHVLDALLAERVARATALDPVFGRDLAARVARFTLEGGKRTRSQFVWWAMRACGGGPARAEAALRIGAALELIQTCALVHDDVMDGARMRRGRPALHVDVADQYGERYDDAGTPAHGRRFGEAAAVLAGDLALAWADDTVAAVELEPAAARAVRELWSALRTEMVAGQYLDVRGQVASAPSVARAVRAACLKSALYSVERPLALGAALAGADSARRAALSSAGRCVGIAFQLRDDLVDVYGDPRRSGKPVGGDIRAGRPTALVAVARARAEAASDRHALGVLRRSLGRADLSESGLAEVRDVLEATGARDTVEARIGRLVDRGLRHLESADLEPEGRRRLRGLLHASAGSPPAPDGTDARVLRSPLVAARADGPVR
ncbi:polyprenyl synthetase family protein [Streptomyces antibioticus]|uniref:polyprenyl synthetase family protein n=1 Tax=Streptomyces antibioticus TaxID=1890 RepID=UPI0033B15DD5